MTYKIIARTTAPNGKVTERSSISHRTLDKVCKGIVGLSSKQAYDLKTNGRVEFEEEHAGQCFKVELTLEKITDAKVLDASNSDSTRV